MSCCVLLISTQLYISPRLLTIAAGEFVEVTQRESLSVGYIPSGDPFGSLNHARIGQRRVGCQPVGLMVAFFPRHEEIGKCQFKGV